MYKSPYPNHESLKIVESLEQQISYLWNSLFLVLINVRIFMNLWNIKITLLHLLFCPILSERVKLKRTDFPLVLRIIQGPCEQVCKVFLMEEDLGEEVTYDVSWRFFDGQGCGRQSNTSCFIFVSARISCALVWTLQQKNNISFHQVAQYIKFEMPVLKSFIIKLKEEEDREVQKLRRR